MRYILFIILLIHTSNLFAQSEKKIIIIGVLDKEIDMPPYCGCFAFATVAEFRVIKNSDPLNFNRKAGVIITCPREKRKKLIKNKKYKLIVSKKNPAEFSWSIFNEEYLKKNKQAEKYWLQSITETN